MIKACRAVVIDGKSICATTYGHAVSPSFFSESSRLNREKAFCSKILNLGTATHLQRSDFGYLS